MAHCMTSKSVHTRPKNYLILLSLITFIVIISLSYIQSGGYYIDQIFLAIESEDDYLQLNMSESSDYDYYKTLNNTISYRSDYGDAYDNTTCDFPQFDPFDPDVVKFAKLDMPKLSCDGGLPDLTYLKGNLLIVNKTKVQEMFPAYNVICKYREVLRKSNSDTLFEYSAVRQQFSDSIKLPIDAEFLMVTCDRTGTNRSTETEMLSKTYYQLIPKLDNLLQMEDLRLRKRLAESSPKETLNVIMLGFDGVSRYQFIRAMNKTYNLLVKDFQSFDMTMHSQVGRNTFPNFLGLFTGNSEKETSTWWKNKDRADEFNLLWKDYEKAGYRTLFSEDYPLIGAFIIQSSGFYNVPTAYYNKALTVAMDADKDVWKHGRHCIGNKPEVLFHYNYLKLFLDSFPNRPLFSLLYSTRISHDEITMLRSADDHVYTFLTELKRIGHLQNTLLITFSDHGIRFGPLRYTKLGDVENRTPFAIFTFPPWFLKKYPDVARNLKTNRNRLTTHYDTHATLQDLLYFKGRRDKPLSKSKHGISLFEEIPRNRTCTEAAIDQEFCLCGYQNFEKVNANSELSFYLAKVVAIFLNSKIDKRLCHALKISNILSIQRLRVVNSSTKIASSVFRMKVKTVPGEGVFEVVVDSVEKKPGKTWDQLTKDNLKDVKVLEGVDRLNMYHGQSECVDDAKMKLFCYCKN
ncbi:uncharacterized protein LOC106061503 [Biomphalaria glabrata]|uniref:Uncharacterized protein LOC106061503 n=1 Tax=Biomphalaria glabrata TaxID=6526 RepID=A0A9U8E6F4_BIOGL|nr:uncharacterized protein LOC106061503 [Biomphalaria glabrata]